MKTAHDTLKTQRLFPANNNEFVTATADVAIAVAFRFARTLLAAPFTAETKNFV